MRQPLLNLALICSTLAMTSVILVAQDNRAISSSRPLLPIDYVASYNLADDGKTFVTSETVGQSGYYSYADANERFAHCTIAGEAYHLPSSAEWNGLLSSYYEYGVNFIEEGLIEGEIETVTFGDVSYSFASDYYNRGDGVSYALRLCKSMETYDDTFPIAPDNRYRCAYRYERVGMTQEEQQPPLDTYIKVSVVYLGEAFMGSISDITTEEWWTEHQSEVQECIIPTVGLQVAGTLYNYASGGFYWATDKAKYMTIFYSGISTSQYPDKSNLCSVRLFKDNITTGKPYDPMIVVTPNAFRIEVGQELDLGKDYYVEITPTEYVGNYSVISSDPEIVSYDPKTSKIKGIAVGDAFLTFQINDTEVSQVIPFTIVPQEEEMVIKHPTIPDAKDFPDLSILLTEVIDTNEIKAYENALGLRLYESTLWDANAHLYVTPQEKVSQTNLNRVNYYYNPLDGGTPYITAQINCIGSIEEAQSSRDFAHWLSVNGFPKPLQEITLSDGSKALCTNTKDLSMKLWIDKKVFFMIIETIQQDNAITMPISQDRYQITLITVQDALLISDIEIGDYIAVYTMDGILLNQLLVKDTDKINVSTNSLSDGAYILLINGEAHQFIIAR